MLFFKKKNKKAKIGTALTLDWPTEALFDSYIEALHEGFRRGVQAERTAEEIEEIAKDPESHMASLNDPTPGVFQAKDGTLFDKVPYETLWLSEGALFIGEFSFRFELNHFLKRYGGHIGYGIRPSLQGRGLATNGMALIKQRARMRGLERLLLTCSPDNPASERVIIKSGGIFENLDPSPYGEGPTKRFWIDLT